MTDQAQAILKQALQLSRDERADLAYQLQASLADPADSDAISREQWEQEWAEEVRRRRQEVESGLSEMVPWEELKPELEAIVRAPHADA